MKSFILVLVTMMAMVSESARSRYPPDNDQEGDILFPDSKLLKQQPRNNRPSSRGKKNELPVDLAMRLNEVDNIEDVLSSFLTNKNEYLSALRSENKASPSLGVRMGGEWSAQKASTAQLQYAKSAKCEPREELVSLTANLTDIDFLYVPTCTRLLRCSGCCNTYSLECQPTQIVHKKLKIARIRAHRERRDLMTYEKFVTVEVEEHTQCKCACKQKANDCNKYQVYDENNCRCRCRDFGASFECSEAEGKIWNPENCACECEETQNCSTGSYFDEDTCRCQRV